MLKPVERQRVADEIVDQLRALILTGHYEPGDKLPPERELAKTLGVNRASLREALKKLEHQGLVRIRQGDGTRVEDFMKTAGLDLVAHLLPLAKDEPSIVIDVLEFRTIYARQLVRLAAERATDADVERLRAVVTEAADTELSPEDLLGHDFRFYIVLGEAAKNRVMTLLINQVRDAVRAHGPLLALVMGSADAVRQHHRAVLAAIEARDPDAAEAAVAAYMQIGTDHVVQLLRAGALPGAG